MKFLSINFRVEKVSLFKNTFVEKQSQIRLSLDESRAFNYFSITNSKFVSIEFANNSNFFDFNSINTREIFVEKIIYDESIEFHSNLVAMIANINFFVQTTIIVIVQIVVIAKCIKMKEIELLNKL